MSDEEAPAGAPAWMATFADLMSLLLCFFVLLLSFSEMDVEKFKQIAGSMANAFGVQRKIDLDDIPMGTSVIALEFAPGQTQETPEETIQQEADDNFEQTLRVDRAENPVPDAEGRGSAGGGDAEDALEAQKEAEELLEALLEETELDAEKLKAILKEEIETGRIDVETEGRMIIVRVREKGSFPSGSAVMAPDFLPTIDKIRIALGEIKGTVAIEGHTDNVPLINGARYESNWELSASRALSVTHQLILTGELAEERLMVAGFSDTRPFTSNETAEGRAMNRRVEILIRQDIAEDEEAQLEAIKGISPDALQILGLD